VMKNFRGESKVVFHNESVFMVHPDALKASVW